MSRHARLTILELGAPGTAWASASGQAPNADDWVVVAQQSDEADADFRRRVRLRAQRLRKEDAQIDAIDVYAAASAGYPHRSVARRQVIEELAVQLGAGGRLTVWSPSNDPLADAELTAILAQFAPILAERQIAMNHQAYEREERSGVRHARPLQPREPDFELEDFA